MAYIETIQNLIGYIPKGIALIRDLIMKLILALSLPETSSFALFAIALSLIISYFWLKQFIVTSMFYKLSTLLNWILLSLLIYILVVYI